MANDVLRLATEDGHCDEGLLAFVAAGGAPPNEVFSRHMYACKQCQAKLASMVATVTIAQDSLADRAYAQPPGRVWQLIEDRAGEYGSNPNAEVAGLIVAAEPDSGMATEESHKGRWFILVLLALLLVLAGAALIWANLQRS